MIKIALILDNNQIAEWQLQALKKIVKKTNISLVLNCTNTITRRYLFKNFLYYILNFFVFQNRLTRKKNFFLNTKIISFESEYLGNWQIIPNSIIQQIKNEDIDIVIKFGMNLLQVPKENICIFGIISYHHGDPLAYRGRPAGFYEILNNENGIGCVIQKINNNIDSGEIYCSLVSKIYDYSYRKTIIKLYENSINLLPYLMENIINDKAILKSNIGKHLQEYPVYSSVRVNSKPLFHWAKLNKLDTIEIPKKSIEIYKLELIKTKIIDKNDLKELITSKIKLLGDRNNSFREREILEQWKTHKYNEKYQVLTLILAEYLTDDVTSNEHTYSILIGVNMILYNIYMLYQRLIDSISGAMMRIGHDHYNNWKNDFTNIKVTCL